MSFDVSSHPSSGSSDDSPRHRYTAELARHIETRWQDQWEAANRKGSKPSGRKGKKPVTA